MILKVTEVYKTVSFGSTARMPAKDIQKPSADGSLEVEQRLSTASTDVLNSLIRSFNAASDTSSHLLGSTELKAPPTIHELEMQLITITRVMEQLSVSGNIKKAESFETQTKKRKLNVEKEDTKRLDHPRTNTAPGAAGGTGTHGSFESSAILPSNRSPEAVQAGPSSDYGEDSDLDEIFHSFSA